MKYRRFLLASPLAPAALVALLVAAAQSSACNGAVAEAPSDGGLDAATDAEPVVGDELNDEITLPPPDASVSCSVNKGEDFIDFCFQKQVLAAEHNVFDPKLGIASSWSATSGLPDTDGGTVVRDVRDDVAYAASLATFAISAEEYGDNSIQATVLSPDSAALASIIVGKLGTLPATYEGDLYMRLRRFAAGLRVQEGQLVQSDATVGGTEIDALADAYGRAIYATYFHLLPPAPAPDGGSADGGDDAGGSADAGADVDAAIDAGSDAGSDASVPELQIPDGILGVPQPGRGVLYDVDQAASGALALIDMATRHASDDPTHSYLWASAALSVFNHLAARARHSSGLYFADLITSGDPDHDALATSPTPNDALLADTQASVAASLLRAAALVQAASNVQLSQYPYAAQAAAVLSATKGVPPDGGTSVSLWDPTPTVATVTACNTIEDGAACGGSGFFFQYLPSTGAVDNSEKTIRSNALAFAAVHRSIVLPGSAVSVDYEVLTALFEAQTSGPNQSFASVISPQASFPDAVSASLALLPASASFTAQADAYALEALTEQWIGRKDCPPAFF